MPAAVVDAVRAFDRDLHRRLAKADRLPVEIAWDRFTDHGPLGWSADVTVGVNYDDLPGGPPAGTRHQVFVRDLADRRAADALAEDMFFAFLRHLGDQSAGVLANILRPKPRPEAVPIEG